MSGGIAYVLDEDGEFCGRCNTELVGFDAITPDEAEELRGWIEEHRERTGSAVAERVLEDWTGSLNRMVKVMPHDYKRALAEAPAEGEAEVIAAAAGPAASPGYAAAAPVAETTRAPARSPG
jgi:glutamate synthase domain-containing protein 3